MSDKNNQEHNISISYQERRWLLYLLDILAINGGFLISLYLREDYQLSKELLWQNPDWFLLLNGLWFFLGYFFEVYDIEKAGQRRTALSSVVTAGFLSFVLFNFIPYLTPTLPPSRQPLFIAIISPLFLLLFGRLIYLFLFSQARFRKRIIIFGAGWAGRTIYQALNEHAQTFYEITGFIDDDPAKLGQLVEIYQNDCGESLNNPVGVPVLGPSTELLDIVKKNRVSTVVLAITQNVGGELYQVLTNCLQQEIEVIPMPLIYEQLTGKVPVEHIGDHWSIAMPIDQPGTHLVWHAAKRAFDLFWSLLGLLFLVITYPFIALVIKLDSKGPVFYTQKRMGRNGRIFQVFKFRSMVTDAETNQAVWAEKNDTRTTRVGKFLRKMHIDEFPQFWNVLIGDMSVVGPRPERPEFIDELAEEIPFYRVRLAVKPGMAGWGLIHQGYGASMKDALEKLQYDLYYIKHQSFWLDLYILWNTIIDAIKFKGR